MSCPLSGDESEATIKWVRAAEALLSSLNVYTVEDDDDVRLSYKNVELGVFPPDTERAMAFLTFAAEQRSLGINLEK